jgi:hypothetical protein
MSNFQSLIKKHQNYSEESQKQIAKAAEGKMNKKHTDFLKTLLSLIEEGKINPMAPESFINKKVYDNMPQEWKGKTDMALINIAHQIQRVTEFYKSKNTPDSSPHLQTMIEHLWLMKQRIEEKYDVFKF